MVECRRGDLKALSAEIYEAFDRSTWSCSRFPTAYRRRVKASQPQQPLSACTGGQGVSAYEQKTQQSPALGFSTAPQAGQS